MISSKDTASYKHALTQQYRLANGLLSLHEGQKLATPAFEKEFANLKDGLVNQYYEANYSTMENQGHSILVNTKVSLIESRADRVSRESDLEKKLESLTKKRDALIGATDIVSRLSNKNGLDSTQKKGLSSANTAIRNLARAGYTLDSVATGIDDTINKLADIGIEAVEFEAKSQVFEDLRLVDKFVDNPNAK
ncbi:MAG: hypothetical protein RLZZ210_789 [Pseudomonadota bacterium]|jgi:hypothetical protein